MVILSILLLSFFIYSQGYTGDLSNALKGILPEKIFLEFAEDGYQGLDFTRIEIFEYAIELLKINPLFGIGAGAFSPIFFSETNSWKGHSHNLFIELSLSYGLPSALIFFSIISTIIIFSGNKIFKNKKSDKSIFDKALWTALFYFIFSQLFDIQYFDGKISIIAWALIASLKNIIEESEEKTVSP